MADTGKAYWASAAVGGTHTPEVVVGHTHTPVVQDTDTPVVVGLGGIGIPVEGKAADTDPQASAVAHEPPESAS